MTKVPNHLIFLLKTILNIKGALVETKRLEKQEPEERVFREKENVRLQAHLDEQRQKYLQQQENTSSKIKYP